MKNLKAFFLIGCLAYLSAYLTPKAYAGEWDRKTVVTFNLPVQVPGTVLPAGSYVFNFIGSTADRNLIEILSKDEQKLYATIEAIPDYHSDATGETQIVFGESKPGAPSSIREWFFPDRRYGHIFVYPEMGTLELGKTDESESATNPAEFAELQSNDAPPTENETDAGMGQSDQTAQSEESDYLRLLHRRQTEPGQLARANEPESENRNAETGYMSYLEALHQKQQQLQHEQTPAQPATIENLPRTASPAMPARR